MLVTYQYCNNMFQGHNGNMVYWWKQIHEVINKNNYKNGIT